MSKTSSSATSNRRHGAHATVTVLCGQSGRKTRLSFTRFIQVFLALKIIEFYFSIKMRVVRAWRGVWGETRGIPAFGGLLSPHLHTAANPGAPQTLSLRRFLIEVVLHRLDQLNQSLATDEELGLQPSSLPEGGTMGPKVPTP